MHRNSIVSRGLRGIAFASALLWPLAAGAVATNLTLTTPAGPAVRQKVIVLDAGGKKVEEKETDDRGAVAFDLPEGSYTVESEDGGRSSSFSVRKPGPVVLTLPLAGGAAAAATTTAASSKDGPAFDIEAVYRYTAGDVDSAAFIDGLGLEPESRSRNLTANGGGVTGRVHLPPCELIGGGTLYLEMGGMWYADGDKKGAQFGQEGFTGLALADTELDWTYRVGTGVRWGLPVGKSEIGFSPFAGFEFDRYDLSLKLDESAFGFEPTSKSKDPLVTSVALGGQIDFRPCRDGCGFYLFAGGGYKFALWNDEQTIIDDTPGGFPAGAAYEIDNRWYINSGIGYRFNMP